MLGVRLDTLPGAPLEGEVGRRVGPVMVRPWLLELGRTELGAPGRAEGLVLGRTTWPEPRDGLGVADGREKPPLLDGRGALLEPRDPWLEEGREKEPPPDPRDDEADDPEEPREPRWGSPKEGLANPIRSRERPRTERSLVFMVVLTGRSDPVR